MLEPASAQTPLAIDRVERARGQGDRVRLRLSGRWLTTCSGGAVSGDVSDLDALLVVQMQGRRHRFPATRERRDDAAGGEAGSWVASFTVPDWAVPEQPGQASLWVGNAVVPVPPPGTVTAPIAPAETVEPPPPLDHLYASGADPPAPGGEMLGAEHGRSGPLADLLFKETVSALHAELEQRSAEAARLRGALAQVGSDLQTRLGTESGLEAAHAELRQELTHLMVAATEQRADFDERVAALGAERDDARAELQKARSELQQARVELQEAGSELHEARAELPAARSELDRRLAEARAEAESQVVAVRGETEARLAAARAEAESQAAAARVAGEAEVAAARGEAESQVAAARRWADEAAAVREQLATAQISREAALGETAGLRAELDRLGSELAVSREQGGSAAGDLSEAQQLLADARALTAQMRGRSGS